MGSVPISHVIVAEHYEYDANSNRTTVDSIPGLASYDDQDRLETYGDLSYTYTDNGELQSKKPERLHSSLQL